MISGTSLISKIPIPSQTVNVENSVSAAVSVAEVIGHDEDVDTRNFVQKFIENQIRKFAQKRIEKLENTPFEKLSEIEKAELEANRKLNYSV